MVAKVDQKKSEFKGKGYFSRLKGMREFNLFLIVVAVIIIMGFTSPYFFQWTNLRVLLSAMAANGIVVIGMTLMLIVGAIDLSVGSMMAFSMTLTALLFTGGMNPWISALIAIIVCAIIGWIMGMLVTKLNLSHFIVTLAFMGILRGGMLILSTGTPISIVSDLTSNELFRLLGQGTLFGKGAEFPSQLAINVIIFIVIAVVADFIVRHSSAMRIVFYTGSNPRAAEYSGINTQRTIRVVGIICSSLSALAGVIYLSKFSGVPMSAGQGLEMIAISSAVIGGASLTGGRGTVLGSILGLSLMTLATNALTLYSVSTFWYDFIRYAILLVAVVIDQLQQTLERRKAS